MLTKDEAKKIALASLDKKRIPLELVILDDLTRPKPYGWIFFYNSKKFLETDDIMWALAGNGPAVVLHDGEVHFLTTAYPIEEAIAMFERENKLGS